MCAVVPGTGGGRIPRQVSGYHLRHLLPEEGFDVARVFAASGTTWSLVGWVCVTRKLYGTGGVGARWRDVGFGAVAGPLLGLSR